MARVWVIKEEDVRLYHDAMVGVARSHPDPWTERGKPRSAGKVVADDALPSAKSLQAHVETYYTLQAIALIKGRVYKARHRAKQKPSSVHLDEDAAGLLSKTAKSLGLTMSETIRYYLDP